MDQFIYKVVPAPRHGIRTRVAKDTATRFAAAIETAINALATEGWEYVRAETLPADERRGLTRRKSETTQNILIFRKRADKTSPNNSTAPLYATPPETPGTYPEIDVNRETGISGENFPENPSEEDLVEPTSETDALDSRPEDDKKTEGKS